MIIFDYKKYLKDVKKNGISATDIHATHKINDLLNDMIFNSPYKKGKVINKVKDIASDYYSGLPDEIIIDKLSESYDAIKINGQDLTKGEKKILTLYKSEMETINSLPDEKLQRLAFASLVAFKYHSYHHVMGDVEYYKMVEDCLADIFVLADFGSVSGTTRNKLSNELVKKGLLYYYPKINPTYKYQSFDDVDHKRWIAFNNMSIPFCVEVKGTQDTEEVFMQMTNYDDIMLYLRYYQGDADVTTCECCGTPILKSGNAKRYCSDCADAMKKASDKARYKLKKAV